jgi:hypothetical protein
MLYTGYYDNVYDINNFNNKHYFDNIDFNQYDFYDFNYNFTL